MKKIKIIVLLASLLFTAAGAKAQYIEDGLRLTEKNGYITPRSGGLNVAYHGISDDFAAIAFNPAGLSLVNKSELSFGFGFLRNNTDADYFNNLQNFTSNDAYLSHAGIVAPFNTEYGNSAIAIGYVLDNNFDNNYEFKGFNPRNTYLQHRAQTGPDDLEDNLAGFLLVGDLDQNGNLYTPITDSLEQSAFVQESGGIHSVYGGAGFTLSKFVSLGFSIEGKWGAYDYLREFRERDVNNIYSEVMQNPPYEDFSSLQIDENIMQNISGITGSVGIQARLLEMMRFGVSVRFPTFYSIEEEFSQSAVVEFDNGEFTEPAYETSGETSYNVTTPWVYAAGVSLHAAGITFAAGVEYKDVTQLEFSDATAEVMNLNSDIIRELVGQTKWGFGAEYDIPLVPLVARASFQSTSSPYSNDVPGATYNVISLGGGVYLAKNVRLDGVFRWSDVTRLRSAYGTADFNRYTYTQNPLNLGVQLTYRY